MSDRISETPTEGNDMITPCHTSYARARRWLVSATFTLSTVAAAVTCMEGDASTIIPVAHAEEKQKATPKKNPSFPACNAKPYQHLHARYKSELDAGSPGLEHELGMALDELPMLYYDHKVSGPPLNKDKQNIPTPSMAYELAKLVWILADGEVKAADHRKIMLDKLQKAAQPGLSQQKEMQAIHDANLPIINELQTYWKAVAKDAQTLMKKVQGLVQKESTAAKALKTPSQAQAVVPNVAILVPTEKKDRTLSTKHAKEFNPYSNIEPWLRPYPYTCDSVSDSAAAPSDILVLEALKALREYATWHQNAAVHRKHRYHALQSFVQLTGTKARPLLKYDGTRYNDPILNGWIELLRTTPDNHNLKGPIEELMTKVLHIVQLQSQKGEVIHRCRNNFTAADITKQKGTK